MKPSVLKSSPPVLKSSGGDGETPSLKTPRLSADGVPPSVKTGRLSANLSSTNPKSSFSVFSKFQAIWQRFMLALICSNQLQVCQKTDRFGNSYWQAYDPRSGDFTLLGTEAEMRMWIEQSYYR